MPTRIASRTPLSRSRRAFSRPMASSMPRPSAHSSQGIVFVRLRPAEVDQQRIAKQLGDMTVKALHHFGAGLLIGTHDVPVIFGIELTRQPGGVDQITEHHGELPAFGIRHVQCGWRDFRLRVLGVLDGRRLCWLRRCRD